jgi:outer membrane protein OmpA-like peptidoglycan-associated protein
MEQDFNDKWEFYKDADLKWRWRRTSPNGNIVGAASEGYVNKTDCEGNASRNGWNGDAAQVIVNTGAKNEEEEQTRASETKAHDLQAAHLARESKNRDLLIDGDRRFDEKARTGLSRQTKNILLMIAGILSVIALILLFMLIRNEQLQALTGGDIPPPRVMILSLDPKENEQVVVFGDTHFEFGQYTLSPEAIQLLAKDAQSLKENPALHVRLAGYTSAKGTEAVNQELSERRANAVRDYLIEDGIAPERITVIGYGRTRPALYEVTPSDKDSKEALANMRVLFEVVVQ